MCSDNLKRESKKKCAAAISSLKALAPKSQQFFFNNLEAFQEHNETEGNSKWRQPILKNLMSVLIRRTNFVFKKSTLFSRLWRL